jgi:hypothetical protein
MLKEGGHFQVTSTLKMLYLSAKRNNSKKRESFPAEW